LPQQRKVLDLFLLDVAATAAVEVSSSAACRSLDGLGYRAQLQLEVGRSTPASLDRDVLRTFLETGSLEEVTS